MLRSISGVVMRCFGSVLPWSSFRWAWCTRRLGDCTGRLGGASQFHHLRKRYGALPDDVRL